MVFQMVYFLQVFRVTSITHVSAAPCVLRALSSGFTSIELP